MRIKKFIPLYIVALCFFAFTPYQFFAHGGPKKEAHATGIVHDVNTDRNRLTITSDPIPSLGWPKMHQKWKVKKGISIEFLKLGDLVHFSIKQNNNGITYVITSIEKLHQKGKETNP